MRKKKCLVLCPDINDATSFWRGAGPFSHLAMTLDNWTFSFFEGNEVDWHTIADCDLVFLQRPWITAHKKIFELCICFHKPVWIDYDDLLYEVPKSNPAHAQFAQENVSHNLDYMISRADFLSVSTQFIADYIETKSIRDSKLTVIENAWPTHLLPWRTTPHLPHKTILWRGSCTHDKDLSTHFGSIQKIVKEFYQWKWLFIGDPGPEITKIIPTEKLLLIPPRTLVGYYSALGVMQASVCIVPLEDNLFNQGKSNIGWQEATYAAAATIAPNFKEWSLPGVIHYDFEGMSLYNAFKQNINRFDISHFTSWQTIKYHRTLDVINEKRKRILNCT